MDYGEREEAFFHPVPCIEYLVCSRGKLCCAGRDVRNREGLAVCAAPVGLGLAQPGCDSPPLESLEKGDGIGLADAHDGVSTNCCVRLCGVLRGNRYIWIKTTPKRQIRKKGTSFPRGEKFLFACLFRGADRVDRPKLFLGKGGVADDLQVFQNLFRLGSADQHAGHYMVF